MDYRLQSALNRWLVTEDLEGDHDRVALAGGVKDFGTVLRQVEIAVKLHHIQRVILINHEDCGAYGPEGEFPDHQRDLRKARQEIHARFPDLKVDLYYLQLDGRFNPIN
jgi:carbonic anhydrase